MACSHAIAWMLTAAILWVGGLVLGLLISMCCLVACAIAFFQLQPATPTP